MERGGSNWLGLAILALTVLTVGALWAGRFALEWAGGGGDAGWAMPPESVRTAIVAARPWQEARTLMGQLTAVETVEVRAELPGRLVQIGFASGDVVTKGAVLARQDTAIEAADLEAARAELKVQRLRRDRLAALQADRGATQMDLDQASADVEVLAARVAGLEARIAQKTLRAPFAGRTGLRDHHPGQLLDAGERITTLVGGDALFVDLWVPATVLEGLSVGTSLDLRQGEVHTQATVTVLEPAADARRRALLARALLAETPEGWRPGMAVEVELPTGEPQPRVIVPPGTVQWSPAGPVVYVVGPGEVVQAKPVEIVSSKGEEVVLSGGLADGSRVVVEGAFKLRDGAVVAEAPAPGAQAQGAPHE